MDYNFSAIEKKWHQYWEENNTYKVSNTSDKPKYYVLDMFPYPSGSGLHVGHPLGYIASDIYARYKRLKGFNVLHPMGFDAFGLPAEQYAIQTGKHPETTTNNNISYYKKQLRRLGFCYDWSREVKTCDPGYYKWTQWMFLQLFHHWFNATTNKAAPITDLITHFETEGTANLQANASEDTLQFTAETWKAMTKAEQQQILMDYRLVYQSEATVNWCPELGTVLANDEVKEGISERGGHPVVKKQMRQWFLRTTAYAERLLSDLDTLAWSDSMKEMQRNWIGRSEGASVRFAIDKTDKEFDIFTTRPDTIFGVTFMVLAPEHELIKTITTEAQQEEVTAYLDYVSRRSDLERQAEKKVTGAFTGAYAVNPFTGYLIPIYISEYVFIGYGTGAIMAVPSDDERDEAFARKFGLPIVPVIDKTKYPGATQKDKLGVMVNSDFITGMEVPDAIRAVIDKVEAMGIGKGKVNYRLQDSGYSRQRYWGEPFPIVYKDGIATPLPESELPLTLPAVDSYEPTGDGRSPLANVTDWVNTSEGKRETDTMPGYAGSSWYFLRYMDPSNKKALVGKKAIAYWENVDLYMGGTEHAVGHLIYSRMWHKFLYDVGLVTTIEPFKRLVNQGMIQGRSSFAYRVKGENKFVSKGLRNQYKTTAIHVPISMVQNDVLDIEAFRSFRSDIGADAEFVLEEGEYRTGYEIEKMSKSKFNVVNPDDICDLYGADCFRLFEMFLGPLEKSKPWITDGIEGVSRFLHKLWRLFKINGNGKAQLSDATPTKDELKVIHRTIKRVNIDIVRLSFNTCVSAFMECVNDLGSLKCDKQEVLQHLVVLMAPFAPHLTEELWKAMGNTSTVHDSYFPTHNEEYLVEASRIYPVQINGKVRAKIDIALTAAKDEAEKIVMANAVVQKWINGKTVRKFIFVPGKIINIVVK